jgi:hypothetical protein
MSEKHESLVDALDGIRDAIGLASHAASCDIFYPQIANGPYEQVLAFNNNEHISLQGVADGKPHFSSHGQLTDLKHRVLAGSRVETTFPVDPTKLPDTKLWPSAQPGPPWDAPPLDPTNTGEWSLTGNPLFTGYSKQAYFFDGGVNSLVTVGPSNPKIVRLKDGGAQFWVGSIGVIAQGTGKYEGVRGMSVYLGSGYLPNWSDDQGQQIKILQTEFVALVSTYFKFVFKMDQA